MLSLDDTIARWLPGVGEVNGYDPEQLVVRQLLNHTSGLYPTGLNPRVAGKIYTRAAVESHRHDQWTAAQLLELAVELPPIGRPGSQFAYANGGYCLAGAIIEAAAGVSYADLVNREILEPLQLNASRIVPPDRVTPYPDPFARAYSKMFTRDGVDPSSVTAQNYAELMGDPELPPLDLTEMNFSLAWAAGSLVNTTSDLIEFYQALAAGNLLAPEQCRAASTTVETQGWLPATRYGLGLTEFVVADGVLRGGTGAIPGTETLVIGAQDGSRMMAISANTNPPASVAAFAPIVAAAFGLTPFAAANGVSAA